jgi:oligosaccharide repeat unit polymerase
VFSIIILYFFWKEINNVANQYAITSEFSNTLYYYRNSMVNDFQNNFENGVNPVVNQLSKMVMVSGFVVMYIMIYNMSIGEKLHQQIKFLPLIITFIAQVILSASRLPLIRITVMALFTMYIYMLFKQKTKFKRSLMFWCKCFFIGCTIMGIFSFIRELVGRIAVEDQTTLEYLTRYTGSSIQSFNLYIQRSSLSNAEYLGQSTFAGLYTFLAKLGVVNNINPTLEFSYSNGIDLGNTYTALRRYINDFGIVGMILCQAICAIFFAKYYAYIKQRRSIFSILLYGYIVFVLFIHAIDEQFFNVLFSINYLIQYIMLWSIYKFLKSAT